MTMPKVRGSECGVRSERQNRNFRPSSLVLRHSSGFSLLEVMVAVAILSMVLVTLLGVKNRSMQDVMVADHITTATLLAKREMTEMLRNPAERPKETESEGNFEEEEEFRDYTWKKTITTLMPMIDVKITEIRVAVLWKEGDRQESVELVSYE